MSRHYELMQQAESYLAQPLEPVARAVSSVLPERAPLDEPGPIDDDCLNLVQRVFLLEQENPPHVVVFAGLQENEGAEGICAAAAEHLAHTVRRPVCIVDADRRLAASPSSDFARSFGSSDAPAHEAPIIEFCTPTTIDNLWRLRTGAAGVRGILTADNLKNRFSELRASFDFVLIDVPPLDRYAEGVVFATLSDGAVLILESGETRRRESEQIVADLRSAGVRILAAVLNNFAPAIPGKLRRFI